MKSAVDDLPGKNKLRAGLRWKLALPHDYARGGGRLLKRRYLPRSQALVESPKNLSQLLPYLGVSDEQSSDEVPTSSEMTRWSEDEPSSVNSCESILGTPNSSSSSSSSGDNNTAALERVIWVIFCQLSVWDRPVAGLRADPFDSLSVPTHKRETVAALDFYINDWAPSQSVVHHRFPQHNHWINTGFALGLRNADLLHAILAFSSCVASSLKGQQPSKDAYESRGRAITYLQTRLDSARAGTDDAAILTVCFLLTADLLMGQMAAARAHRSGLLGMFGSHADFEDLGQGVKSLFVAAEAHSAWVLGEPNVITPRYHTAIIHYPKHPFSPEICSLICYCPNGLHELALRPFINEELLRALSRCGRFLSLTRSISRGQLKPSKVGQADEDFLRSYWSSMDEHLTQTILDLLEQISSTESRTQSMYFERCLCLSLLTLWRTSRKRTRIHHAYAQMRQKLTDLLLSYKFTPLMNIEADCFVWMGVIAAESWRVAGRTPADESAPSLLVAKVLSVNGLVSEWRRLRLVLEKFLWDDDLMGTWRIFWEGIMSTTTVTTVVVEKDSQ